jgi:NAD(P)H-hydrate epimerase
MSPVWNIVSGDEILEIDRYVMGKIESKLLMENAGSCVARIVLDQLEEKNLPSRPTCAIICGKGNNGADGLVVARHLVSTGIVDVDVYLVGDHTPPQNMMEYQIELLKNFCEPQKWISGTDLKKFDIIVDGVFGVGIHKSIDQRSTLYYQSIFDEINSVRVTSQNRPVIVSIDVPSGICATTGSLIYDRPVMADTTVTFGLLKFGQVFYASRKFCGNILLSSISYPTNVLRELRGHVGGFRLITPPILCPRNPDGHKGIFGRGLFISGSSECYGAPYFCSGSFLKAGGGYSILATTKDVGRIVASRVPEVVIRNDFLWDHIRYDVICIGPGLERETAIVQLDLLFSFLAVSDSCPHAIIIDGIPDPLVEVEDIIQRIMHVLSRGICVVLTPHLGEARKIFCSKKIWGQDFAIPEYDWDNTCFIEKVKLVRKLLVTVVGVCNSAELIVVLKGSRSAIISSSLQQDVAINPTGNSGMGTAGSGDVLCGIIAGMICHMRETSTIMSAVSGSVWIHGRSGDIARDDQGGEDGILATDIMNTIPRAMSEVRASGNAATYEMYYPKIIL